jgi:hypothetical protein
MILVYLYLIVDRGDFGRGGGGRIFGTFYKSR